MDMSRTRIPLSEVAMFMLLMRVSGQASHKCSNEHYSSHQYLNFPTYSLFHTHLYSNSSTHIDGKTTAYFKANVAFIMSISQEAPNNMYYNDH